MKLTESPDSFLAIGDIALAAYLSVTGHAIQGIRQACGRGLFLFAKDPKTEAAVLAFLNRQAPVDAATFHDSIKSLKSAVATQ